MVAEMPVREESLVTLTGVLWVMVNNTVCVSAQYFYRDKIRIM